MTDIDFPDGEPLDGDPQAPTPNVRKGPFPWSTLHGDALSYSLLKHMQESPAKFRWYCEHEFVPRRGTAMGNFVDRAVLGGTPVTIYEGQRRGSEWKAFAAVHHRESIATRSEVDACEEAIDAIKTAPHNLYALSWLEGDKQVPLEWEMCGFKFRTRGLDVLRRDPCRIVDLKTGPAEPSLLQWQSRKMGYQLQLGCYDAAARYNGLEPLQLALVSLEMKPPYCATVFEIGPDVLADVRRLIVELTDKIKRCLDRNQWPGPAVDASGYATSVMAQPGAMAAVTGIDDLEDGD